MVTQLLISYLIQQIAVKDFIQTYTIFPLLSEDGVREMVIVVAVTSSSFTRRGSGGGGAKNKMFTRNNNLTLVCIRWTGCYSLIARFPPALILLVFIHTPGAGRVKRRTVKVKCLAQEHLSNRKRFPWLHSLI